MIKTIFSGGFDDNFSYLICNKEDNVTAIVDPCGDVMKLLPDDVDDIRYILLTHGHDDHFDQLDKVLEKFPSAQLVCHREHPRANGRGFSDGDLIDFGKSRIEIISTPGHSRDSLTFLYRPDLALFTGDTLFVGCIGFCRSRKTMADSLLKLRELPEELIVYSGHNYGDVPHRKLGEEKLFNPEFSTDFIRKLASGK